jgi:hypothetical protein
VVTINEASTDEGMTMAKKQSKSDKVGHKPTSKAKKSSPKSVTRASAKGRVSPKAMEKIMAKLPTSTPQFAAGQPDTGAQSAEFGAHMIRLMDQQG